MERTIINESLVLIDEIFYKMMVASQKGKPLFVPEKNKMLRYVDDSFIEENEYTTALYDFFVNNMKLGESDAWDTVGDCILEIKTVKILLKKCSAILIIANFCRRRKI